MRRIDKLSVLLASACALGYSNMALAQAANEPSDREAAESGTIFVTAQRRSEQVQDVPQSVTVIDSAQLERQQINSVRDLARVSPALEIIQAPGQSIGGGGQIRGLGTQTFGAGATGAVGIVVDGVSQGSLNVSDLFDLERIEVLKGPQGTLFGLTASAGVINITTRAPSFTEFSGRVRTELTDAGTAGSVGFGQQVVQASVNIPLTSNLAARVAGSINRRQGPGRNALDGSLDYHNSASIRGRLYYEPTDRLTLDFSADYGRNREEFPDFFTVFRAVPALADQLANCRSAPGAPATPVVASEDNTDYCSALVGLSGGENYGASMAINYDLGGATLTSISALRRTQAVPLTRDSVYRLENAYFGRPPSSIGSTGAPVTAPTKLFTQEFRIDSSGGSRFGYTAGVYFSDQSSRGLGGSRFQVLLTPALGAPSIPLVNNIGTPGEFLTSSVAAFGQGTFHLTDQLGIIAGARYQSEYLEQLSITTAGVQTRSRTDVNNFSWRLGLQYDVDQDLMMYASAARGYKGPQFAGAPAGSPPGTPALVIRPEIPTSFEIGAKQTMFDGRAILDMSGFYTEIKDYQGQTCATLPSGLLNCAVTNLDGVISKGIEANLFGRIGRNFSINAGAIWNQTTYPEKGPNGGPFLVADGSDLSGQQLINVPEWKITVSGEYNQPVTERIEAFFAADAVYRSRVRYGTSADPLLSYHDNVMVGGRFGIRDADGLWAASVFVKNLTDERQPFLRQAGFPYAGNYGQMLGTGSFRQVGLSLEAGF